MSYVKCEIVNEYDNLDNDDLKQLFWSLINHLDNIEAYRITSDNGPDIFEFGKGPSDWGLYELD